MDRRLMEMERKFHAGVISRREFVRRAAVIGGGSAAALCFLGRVLPGGAAWASPGITLDPGITLHPSIDPKVATGKSLKRREAGELS